ncbi:hypothetical protein E2C01_081690 [Portunus trituberculatus]|uniref:Uncharacterized protein n=1 Tax=Portunus trituberculatus TaxID=210409 RepID=A0A5B7IX72_PORTR|nr:hypothetical protein [Portunus trituberculatus]
MQHHSLVGCRVMAILQARRASSMGLPHVDWLHGSMPSQVQPWPADAGADPGGAVVSQAAATGWP